MASFEIFDTLPSTQNLCLDRLRAGKPGPGWILTREQTKGLGRHGRTWVGIRGNFMASRFERMTIDVRSVPQLSFVTAVALYEMLRPMVPDTDAALRIKWPNDILHKSRKLAGILVQTETTPEPTRLGIVIGVGVNLAAAPIIEAYPTCSLRDIGADRKIDPVVFLHKLDGHLDGVINLWRDKGFGDIARAWLKRAYGRDMRLSLTHEGAPVSGVLHGLDAFGALQIVADDAQTYTVTGGDIDYAAVKPHAGV